MCVTHILYTMYFNIMFYLFFVKIYILLQKQIYLHYLCINLKPLKKWKTINIFSMKKKQNSKRFKSGTCIGT